MACQIGITTDPERRKREWEQQRPRLRNWKILATAPTKSGAQSLENEFAASHGCNSGAGGSGPENAVWSVYKFDY